MEDVSFDPELIHSIFKQVWSKKADRNDEAGMNNNDEVVAGTSKKGRQTAANANALKISCELIRMFITVDREELTFDETEAVQRASVIAEAEGSAEIEATHLERVLPQLLLDF